MSLSDMFIDIFKCYKTCKKVNELNKMINEKDKIIEKLNEKIQDYNKKNDKLQNKVNELEDKLDECNRKIKYMSERICNLTKKLANAIQIPNFNFSSKYKTTIEDIACVIPTTDLVFADNEYYILELDEWKMLLSKLNEQLKIVYKKDISDCDDFTLLMNTLVVRSAYLNNLNKQLAFGIAWSTTHAFNIFIVKEKTNIKLYIYEPQIDKIYENIPNNDYIIKKIWFMG